MPASRLRRTLVAACSCAFLLAVALIAEERQARTFLVKIDGKEVEITTGQEITIPCAHAEGKTHTLSAAESPLQRFARPGLQCAYPSACTLTFDEGSGTLAVRIRHPAGPILKLDIVAASTPVEEALERHASTLRSHLVAGGAADVKVSEISSSLAGAITPGRQVACVLLGDARVSEIYYISSHGRVYSFSLDYSVDQVQAAQDLFSSVGQSLRFE